MAGPPPSRASGCPLAPSQTRTCRFPASGSSGGRLAREHRLAPAFSARSRYPLLFGGRISMLSVISAFPINGSSFFRVPPLATPWLPSVSVRHVSIRYYEGTTTSPIPSRPLALEACVRLLPLHRLATLALRFDAPAARLDVVNPVSSFPRLWLRQRTGVLPSSQGSLFMHLCHGLGPRQDGLRLAFLVASRTVPAGSTAKTPALVLSWLNPAASVLTVNASCQPRG